MKDRDQILEQCVLKTMSALQISPVDLIEDYFYGAERELYKNFRDQMQDHNTIELPLVPKELYPVLISIKNLTTVKIDNVIPDLHSYYVKRSLDSAYYDVYEDPINQAQVVQQVISDCLLKRSKKPYNHKAELSLIFKKLKDISDTRAGKVSGYSTGIDLFDKCISGIQAGKFYVLGALKKTGKSRFMAYLAFECLKQNAGVFVNSLEMSSYQLNILLMANKANINSALFDVPMKPADMNCLKSVIENVKNCEWMIYREKTVPDLRARILQERQKRKVDVVFIDFIQRMFPVNYTKDRVRGMEEVSMALADMSRELDVAVFSLSQLSGEAEKLPSDTIPDMRYFKESQGITENADVIIMMHDPKRNEERLMHESTKELFFKVDQRYGVSGVKFGLIGDLSTCRYKPMMEQFQKNKKVF